MKDEFNKVLKEYAKTYDIESLSTPNDRANLELIINNAILIKRLQEYMASLVNDSAGINAAEVLKINNTIASLQKTNSDTEKLLSIDRKTRKQEQEQSPVDYIENLRARALEFLHDPDRIIYVYCKACKIMVGRISGVYDSTEFEGKFKCPQCDKFSSVRRKERDVFFDLKSNDKDWRRKYPIEVVQNKEENAPDIEEDDDILLNGDLGLSFDEE